MSGSLRLAPKKGLLVSKRLIEAQIRLTVNTKGLVEAMYIKATFRCQLILHASYTSQCLFTRLNNDQGFSPFISSNYHT